MYLFYDAVVRTRALGSSSAPVSDLADIIFLGWTNSLDCALLLELVRELLDFLELFFPPTCPVQISCVIDENIVCLILLRLGSILRCFRSALL